MSLHNGRLLCVFDAVPASLHLLPSHLSSLHTYLRTPPTNLTTPFPHLLALPTLTSTLVHLQFFSPPNPSPLSLSKPSTSPSSSCPPPLRLLAVQSDGSFLIWGWSPPLSLWSHLSRGFLPLSLPLSPSTPRRITSASLTPTGPSLVWTEQHGGGRVLTFLASMPQLGWEEGLPAEVSAQSAAVIPMASTSTPAITPTQYGVVFSLSPPSTSPASCFYWASHRRELVRVPPLANALQPLHVHAMTRELCAVTLAGEVYALRETPPSSLSASPFLSRPVVEWEMKTRLVAEDGLGGEELFPLSPSSLFFVFQHTACIVTAAALHFFSMPVGVCIHRLPLPPSTSPCSVHLAVHGFSGTGAVLSTGHQLLSIVSSPISAHLVQLTAASPHGDLRRRMEEEESGDDGGLPVSDTFASPSFTATFPSLSAVEASSLPSSPSLGPVQSPLSAVTPSTLIPSLPYPALSHFAAQVSATYGPSLQSQNQQQLLHRWMGIATASSPSHLSPPSLPHSVLPASPAMLSEALACLQSPAVPLSMIVSPSSSHWLHGHEWDAEQTAVVKEELNRWLEWMTPLTIPPQSTSPPTSFPSSPDRSPEFFDRLTPLNIALHPLLTSISSTLTYLQTLPPTSSASPSPSSSTAVPRPPALPSSLAIPTLPPLSSQLSRAVTNRSSSHLTSKEPSLSTLALTSPTPTFLYLRSLLGLDPLTPLPPTSSTPPTATPTPVPFPSPSPRVHPNMMLLNDEIRLKKELGVFGKDIAINTAGLQRSEAMPLVELMCRLYDDRQPDMVTAFVHAVEGGGGGGGGGAAEGSGRGTGKWQRAIGDRDLSRYCDRALQCLPSIPLKGEGRRGGDAVWLDRLLARAWLLKESSRLCEAVLLLLEAAEGAADDGIRLRCEEEAISMAYCASPEHIQLSPEAAPTRSEEGEEDDGVEAEEEADGDDSDCVRAELYHHLSSYFVHKATATADGVKQLAGESGVGKRREDERERSRVALVDAALQGLDGRIRSLSPPHFSAQHMGLLLQQQLHQQQDG